MTETRGIDDTELVRSVVELMDANPICIDTLLDACELLSRIDDERAELALDVARTSPHVIEHLASRRTVRSLHSVRDR